MEKKLLTSLARSSWCIEICFIELYSSLFCHRLFSATNFFSTLWVFDHFFRHDNQRALIHLNHFLDKFKHFERSPVTNNETPCATSISRIFFTLKKKVSIFSFLSCCRWHLLSFVALDTHWRRGVIGEVGRKFRYLTLYVFIFWHPVDDKGFIAATMGIYDWF